MDKYTNMLPLTDYMILKSMDEEILDALGIDLEEIEKSLEMDLAKACNKGKCAEGGCEHKLEKADEEEDEEEIEKSEDKEDDEEEIEKSESEDEDEEEEEELDEE